MSTLLRFNAHKYGCSAMLMLTQLLIEIESLRLPEIRKVSRQVLMFRKGEEKENS